MLASYQVGLTPAECDNAKNLLFPISNGIEQCLEKGRIETISVLPKRLDSLKRNFKSFPLLRSGSESGKKKLGIIVLDVASALPANFDAELEKFALKIELGRSERIVRSVSRAHKILKEAKAGVDNSLKELAQVVAEDIGAFGVLFKNSNLNPDWMNVAFSAGERSETPVGFSYAAELDADGPFSICRASGVITQHGTAEIRRNCAFVPLLQIGFEFDAAPILDSDVTQEALTTKSINDISIAFFEKRVPGYLQDRFSDTDITILQSVFGFVDEFASAGIFQENYAKVASHLKANNLENEIDLASTHDLLKSLSVAFTAVFAVRAENVGDTIKLGVSASTQEIELADPYLKRLKERYLQGYFSNLEDYDDDDAMKIGFDFCNGRRMLEIHLPGMSGETRVFLLVYEENMMSMSVFRSLLLLFRELHVRLQKNENANNRANYMMQVRHAVVHHFAAAHKSMATMRRVWMRSQRHHGSWMNLLSDPIFPTVLTRAHWSLAQAQLVLENGRFLLKDINSTDMDKKPYKILDIVQECLTTLQDQRQNKDLTVYARPVGDPPSIMNGDATLIRIAIMNLIDNAFKYSPNGKTVSWRVEFFPDRYRFEISSGGVQLDPDNRNHLFRIGVRGKQADRLNPRQGTGLGLPIAHKILFAHSENAKLDFTSTSYDKGLDGPMNTFFFEMPYLTGTSQKQIWANE